MDWTYTKKRMAKFNKWSKVIARAPEAEGVKPKACIDCPLYFQPGPVEPAGEGDVWVVMEGPSDADLRRKEAAPSAIIKLAMGAAGLEPGECRFMNAVRCKPRGVQPTPNEVRFCAKARLHAEAAQMQPKVVLAFGAHALDATTLDYQSRPVRTWRGAVIDKDPQ